MLLVEAESPGTIMSNVERGLRERYREKEKERTEGSKKNWAHRTPVCALCNFNVDIVSDDFLFAFFPYVRIEFKHRIYVSRYYGNPRMSISLIKNSERHRRNLP